MRLRGVFVTIVIVLILIFTVINWPSLAVNLPLNLLLFRVQAPLGLILISFTITLTFLFLLLSLLRRAGQLRQITHLEHELEHERAKVEKKRLAEIETLENRLNERFTTLEKLLSDNETRVRGSVTEHYGKLEAHERAQAERLEERVLLVRNELAADIAQIETSLKQGGQQGASYGASAGVDRVIVGDAESDR